MKFKYKEINYSKLLPLHVTCIGLYGNPGQSFYTAINFNRTMQERVSWGRHRA